jgi:hypothetical protein
MQDAHSSLVRAACSRTHNRCHAHDQSSKLIARFGRKMACLPLRALPAGLVLALLGIALGHTVQASDRTTILDFFCETYESARQVALEQSWKRPEGMPDDCRTLFKRGYEGRAAKILQIIEVVQIGDGRWIEIGRVHRNSADTGFSAGTTEQLHLF